MNPVLTRIGKTLLVVVGLIEVGLFIFLSNSIEERLEPTTPTQPRFRLATQVASNDQARFTFHFPPEWEVAHDASHSTLKDPSERVVVALGRAPAGGLLALKEQMAMKLAGSYEDVAERSTRSRIINGNIAQIAMGGVTNKHRAPLRYVIAVIEGKQHNYAISAFVSDQSNRKTTLESIDEVIASFEPEA